MCGISGFFSSEQLQSVGDLYYAAHQTISHRGPDDEGFCAVVENRIKTYKGNATIDFFQTFEHINQVANSRVVLGQSRLAIIDLTASGHQPMLDPNGRYAMVFNGEIYNYKELKAELQAMGVSFHSNSDTEVALLAFCYWGEAAFNRFNGMWAIAIYDHLQNRLILSRDRFGVKPLYYYFFNDAIYFSSEIKFIKKLFADQLKVNYSSVNAYLGKCWLNWSEETFWKEICEVLPGYTYIYHDRALQKKEYWTFVPEKRAWNLADAVDEFSLLFEDSLRLRMRSDVEVGCLLSGGLDSNLLVATLNKIGLLPDKQFKSFSAVYSEQSFSEKSYIDNSVQRFSLDSNLVYPTADDVPEYTDKMLHYLEEPFRTLSTYALFKLYEQIHHTTDVKVVLNGQGSDELFGGYTTHYFLMFADLMRRGRLPEAFSEMRLFKQYRDYPWKVILMYSTIHAIRMLLQSRNFNTTTFDEVKKSALREYLRDDDRSAMAFGLEARLPFLDYRLVEFAFSLDTSLKIHNFSNKLVPRTYGEDILPEAIIGRRDKMGFISPQEVWHKTILRDYIVKNCTVFANKIQEGIPIQRPNEYLKFCNRVVSGENDEWTKVWRIVCLTRWLEMNA